MNKVLMIAFHYPPEGRSSGVHRTLMFSRYLPEAGWKPMVLSAHPRAYSVTRTDQLGDVPDDIVVRRAFALDTGRHLAIAGRYPLFAALPDRWSTWWLGAVVAGLRMIRRYRPQALWTTFPIATAHAIGYTLHRLTKLPWVADFRDSMTEDNYPTPRGRWRACRALEGKTMRSATRTVFTARSAVAMYADRYPDVCSKKFAVIPNGYDEESFRQAEASTSGAPQQADRPLVLLHSGALSPVDRDPRQFYQALSRLAEEGRISPRTLKIVLRSSGHDDFHSDLVARAGLNDIVSLAPRLPYREALREMLDVDGLLIFQAANCNHQVPAKIYEYFRARTPILALTDAAGDTAKVLRDAGGGTIVPLDDEAAIATGLLRFLEQIRGRKAVIATDEEIEKHSRLGRTQALASLLSESLEEVAPR